MTDKRVEPGSLPLANHRWEAFCRFYAFGDITKEGKHRGNATKAYESAGYNVVGDRSAGVAGQRLLQNVEIKQRVTFLSREFWKRMDMTNEELLARLGAIIRFDPARLHEEGGALKEAHDIDEETRMALAGVEMQLFIPSGEGEPTVATKKYKAADKNAAIRTLATIRRLIGPEINVTVNNGSLSDRLAAARKRAREKRKE